jgi:hypothetical protein
MRIVKVVVLALLVITPGLPVDADDSSPRPEPTKYFENSQHPPTMDQAKVVYGHSVKVIWTSVVALGDDEHKPLMPDEAVSEYRDGTQSKIRPYLAPYAKRFGRLAADIALIGNSLATFLPQTVCPIFDIVMYRDRKCAFVNIGSDNVYNTIHATARERAAKIFSSIAARSAGAAAGRFADSDVKYVAVFVTYGARDFAEDSATSEPETMAVIAPIASALAFKNGEISDSELLRKSAILISETGARSFSRVELSLN